MSMHVISNFNRSILNRPCYWFQKCITYIVISLLKDHAAMSCSIHSRLFQTFTGIWKWNEECLSKWGIGILLITWMDEETQKCKIQRQNTLRLKSNWPIECKNVFTQYPQPLLILDYYSIVTHLRRLPGFVLPHVQVLMT